MNDSSPTFHPSAAASLQAILTEFPDTAFLALGQTALWDEPTKASLRLALDAYAPEARLIAGVHDTDYFAKLPGAGTGIGGGLFALVGHDDAATRGLWSAAGEMSRLFGSEDVPTRAEIERRAGVSLQRALGLTPEADKVYSDLTTAWGWTGIIYTENGRPVARDIRLAEILPTLRKQITWAVQGSADCLVGERAQAAALSVAETVLGWVDSFAASHPDASLTDLYRDLLPRFYELLLGAPPANLSTTSTSLLLRFNRKTASLPRFAFLDLFLNPVTRRAAIDAYNLAVGGTDAYTLDRFGSGALPFDLVVPGRGRGTLAILDDGTVRIETAPMPIVLCDQGCSVTSAGQLAELVERALGPDVVLVGKAVTLLPMLAAEYVMVFHEGASAYTDRVHRMMDRMREKRLAVPALRPLLRIRYATWDALSARPACGCEPGPGDNVFRLPEFLAQAFQRPEVGADEFAACWRHAIAGEERRLDELAALRSPRALLGYLARVLPDGWTAAGKEYDAAHTRLLSVWGRAQAIQGRVYTGYDQIRRLRAEAARLEKEKGDDFRTRVQPLRERMHEARAAGDDALAAELSARIDALQRERAERFDNEIANRRSQIRYAQATVRELKAKRLALERGEEAATARATQRRIEAEAELARARLAGNSLQTIHGLPHTAFRPSAWWFPLADPSGGWFQRLAAAAEYYREEL